MIIKDWYITGKGISPFKAPEDKKIYISGNIYGSNRFKDGELIHTSSIVSARNSQVTTKNKHVYELGKEHPTYLEEYPNCLERLMIRRF